MPARAVTRRSGQNKKNNRQRQSIQRLLSGPAGLTISFVQCQLGRSDRYGMIDKLEFLIALSRERHFGHAAEACDVSQPTFSAGIKQLEDNLGVLLVERGSRFQGFTPEGERVLDWARRIVSDARSMHQEIDALKFGLSGHLRVAVIPTALSVVAMLTTPYQTQHPDVNFTILSRNSHEVLGMLENLEIDAGITYLNNEPLGRVQSIPLYTEEYKLLTSTDGPFANRRSVTWAEVSTLPLCLLTPDMQNRRIVDAQLSKVAVNVTPKLESDSVIVLIAHVRAGNWASVLPARLAEALGATENVRAIRIVKPSVTQSIGLVVPQRNPLTPLINALVTEAKQLAPLLRKQAPTGPIHDPVSG